MNRTSLSSRRKPGSIAAALAFLVLGGLSPALAQDVIELGAPDDSQQAPAASPDDQQQQQAPATSPDILEIPATPPPAGSEGTILSPEPDVAPSAPPESTGTPIPPSPDKVANRVAVFTGLDKITGRTTSFDVYIDETVQFGALQVTPRVCYNRPPTESEETDAFVQVDEIGTDRKISRIFSGWMFAASPGLHAVDNAVYDVWLTDCKMTSDVPPPTTTAPKG